MAMDLAIASTRVVTSAENLTGIGVKQVVGIPKYKNSEPPVQAKFELAHEVRGDVPQIVETGCGWLG
jgi:hypothetical protein